MSLVTRANGGPGYSLYAAAGTELPQARVLLVGVGLHTRKNYLAALREHPLAQLVAAVDRVDNLSEARRLVRAVNADARVIGSSQFKGDVLPEDLRLELRPSSRTSASTR